MTLAVKRSVTSDGLEYLHLAEFTIGLATGSIVLIVGASFLHGKEGHLPSFYTNPLITLAGSALAGIVFMALLILNYEEVQHGNPQCETPSLSHSRARL